MKVKLIISLTFVVSVGLSHAETYKVALKRGEVSITRGGKEVTGDAMSGDTIKVGKASMLILKSPKETMKIFQNTVLTPTEEADKTVVKLARGALVSLVKKKSFEVKTTSTVLGVRGTQFFVQATGKDDLWMCVQEGVVNVATKGVGKPVDVPAGKGVFVGPKEISSPKAYKWTKGINWKMDPEDKELDHKIKLNYDLLNNFYD